MSEVAVTHRRGRRNDFEQASREEMEYLYGVAKAARIFMREHYGQWPAEEWIPITKVADIDVAAAHLHNALIRGREGETRG